MRKENAVVYQNHIAFSTTCCVKIMGNRIMLRFLFCQGGQSGTFHFQQLEVVQSRTCFYFYFMSLWPKYSCLQDIAY